MAENVRAENTKWVTFKQVFLNGLFGGLGLIFCSVDGGFDSFDSVLTCVAPHNPDTWVLVVYLKHWLSTSHNEHYNSLVITSSTWNTDASAVEF